jgi:GPH family glycoside/pentoside/hexuronide:cation symporter
MQGSASSGSWRRHPASSSRLIVLTFAGIQEGAQPDKVTDSSLTSLGWGYAVTLLAAWTLMMLCVGFYRISRESHENNLATLAARGAEEASH